MLVYKYYNYITTDVSSFLKQRHTIKGQEIKITVDSLLFHEEEDDDTTSANDNIIPGIIEVTGDVSNTKRLKTYFEGVKSGGGREKKVEHIRHVDDVVHVKFVSTEGMYNISFKPLMYT